MHSLIIGNTIVVIHGCLDGNMGVPFYMCVLVSMQVHCVYESIDNVESHSSDTIDLSLNIGSCTGLELA